MFHDTPIITKLYIEVCNINMHSGLYLIILIRSKIIGVLPVHCGLQYKYAFRLDLKLLGCYPTSLIPTFNGDIMG